MAVGAHLGIDVRDYDRRIRTFIPDYELMLDTAAAVTALLAPSSPIIVDLGTGSGALAGRCSRAIRGARIVGIDEDESMLAMAHGRVRSGLTTIASNFERTAFPRCDAITASFALHHLPTRRRKAALYARAFAALRRGGVLVNADCCVAADRRVRDRDHRAWLEHLTRTYRPSQAASFLRSWAREDTYFTLHDETAMLRSAGFDADTIWRRGAFAVIAALKRSSL